MKILESDQITKLYKHIIRVESDFHSNEELRVDPEDANVEYEVTDTGMSIENVNKDAKYIADQLKDTISNIRFIDLDINECDFEDESDGESGHIDMKITFEANGKITQSEDLELIGELFLDDFSDNAEGEVSGTVVYSQDDFDPFSDYGHTEQILTDDINETIGFSYDYKTVKVSLISIN